MRQVSNLKGTTDGYGGIAVDPHKDEGGKRKGRMMKRKTIRNLHPQPTIAMARAALQQDPNAVWDKSRKCLIYKREA